MNQSDRMGAYIIALMLITVLVVGCTQGATDSGQLYCVGMCSLNTHKAEEHENTTSDNLTDEQRDDIGRLLDQGQRSGDNDT